MIITSLFCGTLRGFSNKQNIKRNSTSVPWCPHIRPVCGTLPHASVGRTIVCKNWDPEPEPPPARARDITERPHAPSGVAAFTSAHSKTPYITPSMNFFLWEWGSKGAQGAAVGICLLVGESCSRALGLQPGTFASGLARSDLTQ